MLYIKDRSGAYLPAPRDAVLAAARRLSRRQLRPGAYIRNPNAARAAISELLGGYQYEMFACLFLDSAHRVLAFEEMFRGSVNTAIIHPREVVKEALRLNAASVVLAHNHPSGVSSPSDNDLHLTAQLKQILAVVDVRVLDHLVIGEEITSLAEQGRL
ncbi:MAG: DNA repair protein RadC [Desulfobacteraceae bacterium]|nr:DNA repair protein RadC [Desulfobacteraceae bacterium]